MSSNDKRHGKVAVVTGAGSGIGRAVALALVEAGYQVVLVGRRAEPLQAVAELTGGQALAVPTDVSKVESVNALFDQVREVYGRVDVLFNNAGVNAPPVGFDELTPEHWLNTMNTNLTGSFFCAQAAFRLMKSQTPRGGRIINNGSISAHAPRPHSAPYTATKHPITGLTKAIALDGRAFDIACGQIDIGNALTTMSERMARGVPQANGSIEVEPMMDVRHVAESVVHMASLPLSANVPFMTIMATNMPYIGRG